jgi:hypothetical protein
MGVQLKIYLAALYSERLTMLENAAKLREMGHEVTSRWIDGMEEGQTREYSALLDLADIKSARCVMSFSLPYRTSHIGGGRHVEFGMAYVLGKRMVVVGEKGEHVFHYLPGIEHYETLEKALEALNG